MTLLSLYVAELLALPVIRASAVFSAWLRPSNEPPDTVSLNDVVAAGWVLKERPIVRSLKRRWALLTREHIAIFKRPLDVDADERPIRIVVLRGATAAIEADNAIRIVGTTCATTHAAAMPTVTLFRCESAQVLAEWCAALDQCGVSFPPLVASAMIASAAMSPPTITDVNHPAQLVAQEARAAADEVSTDEEDSDADSAVARSRHRSFTVSAPASSPEPTPRGAEQVARRRSLSVSGSTVLTVEASTRAVAVKQTIDMAIMLMRRHALILAATRERAGVAPDDASTLRDLADLCVALTELSVKELMTDELFRAKVSDLRALLARNISEPVNAVVARTLFAYSRVAQWVELAASDGDKDRSADVRPTYAATAVPIAAWTEQQQQQQSKDNTRRSSASILRGSIVDGSPPVSDVPRAHSSTALHSEDSPPSPTYASATAQSSIWGTPTQLRRRSPSGTKLTPPVALGMSGSLVVEASSPSPSPSLARRRVGTPEFVPSLANVSTSAPSTPRSGGDGERKQSPRLPTHGSDKSLVPGLSPRMSPRLARRRNDEEHVCRICEARVAGRRLEEHSRVCADVNSNAVRQLGWEEQIDWMVDKLETAASSSVVVESDDVPFVMVPHAAPAAAPSAIDKELTALMRRARELRIDSSKAIARCDQLTLALAELLKNTTCTERQHLFGARFSTLLGRAQDGDPAGRLGGGAARRLESVGPAVGDQPRVWRRQEAAAGAAGVADGVGRAQQQRQRAVGVGAARGRLPRAEHRGL
jgi:hypothetical protein